MPKQNRGIVFKGQGEVEVKEIPYPELEVKTKEQMGRRCPHGAVVKPIATNICGSDMHMVRGRAPVEKGFLFGHEITGEVVEVGPDVEFIKVGDWVSVPFNVSCGRCSNCKEGKTNGCLNVNPKQPGGAYGYFQMGGWPGGQAEYVLVPYADWNLLPIPHKSTAMDKILDLAMLSDILPTGYHGAVTAGVKMGSNVYIAGAGPVGLCAAACCLQVLGAGSVIVSDYEPSRLALAKAMGCETYLIKSQTAKGVTGLVRSMVFGEGTLADAVEKILGEKYVDCAIDCVGFECNGQHGRERHTHPEVAEVLNDCFNVVKPGGCVGVPGVYVPVDTGAEDSFGKQGGMHLEWGTAWNKALTIVNGQCPVMAHNKRLMNAVLTGRLHVAEYLNTQIIGLDQAPEAYKEFDQGAAKKFVIDPHNSIPKTARSYLTERRKRAHLDETESA